MDREQLVRERAYLIWQEEGCPSGCEQEHWERAVREIGQQTAQAPGADSGSDTGATPEPALARAPVPIGSETVVSEAPAAATATGRPKRAPKAAAKAPATRSLKGKAGKKPA